jgi:hypothetical protein
MNFEKISESKFKDFEKSEVVNPILISGGKIETSRPGYHDTCDSSGASYNQVDNLRESANGTPMSSDPGA